MGWISLEAAAKNVITTLKGLLGKIQGFKIATNPHGMFPTFFDIRTGGYLGPGTSYSPMSTALMMAGVQFAVTFFEKNAALLPGPPGTVALISSLFSELWHSVDFESLPCSRAGLVDKVAGTGVPMLQDANASLCSATQYPQLDGLYEYDEEHYAIWYAYQSACSGYAAGGCPNKAIETMWSKWQGRRNKPNHAYGGRPLMTMWSGYVLQLPYYTTHPFNSDPVYTALFRESWSADWQYYNNTRHAGERGRYGLGAGPTPAWCSGGGYVCCGPDWSRELVLQSVFPVHFGGVPASRAQRDRIAVGGSAGRRRKCAASARNAVPRFVAESDARSIVDFTVDYNGGFFIIALRAVNLVG